MTYTLAISIINFRTGDLTLACVQSALNDIKGLNGVVVVVDNASGDGSAEQIANWIAQQPEGTPVELIRSPNNTGFSGGHNLGIGAVEADYYLLFNSDAVLRPGFCKEILRVAEANPKAGLIAPRLEGDDGVAQNSFFRFAGPASELMRGAETGPLSNLLKQHEIALGTDPDPEDVEWASFACILLRTEMINQIGPMDEGYFLYFEDAEYCLRARRAGWGIALALNAVAVHYRGGSGPVKALQKAKKRMPAYFYASRSRFLYQANGRFGLLSANLLWHLGRGIAQLRRIFGKPVPPAAKHETRDIWINAFNPLGPRHAPDE